MGRILRSKIWLQRFSAIGAFEQFGLPVGGLLLMMACALLFCASFVPEPPASAKLKRKALQQLGHYFFFDKRLSFDNAKSCASCHDPLLAFSDGYRLSINAKAQLLRRNAPSILNLNNRTSFDWANPAIDDLTKQMQRPLFSKEPIELGLAGNEAQILQRFINDKQYARLFQKAFHKPIKSMTIDAVTTSIAAYELSLQSRNSRYDQYLKNKRPSFLSKQETLGMRLFFTDSLGCKSCHGGLDFYEPPKGSRFANTGLYNCSGSYPISDIGLEQYSKKAPHNGSFRIPGLRNVALTAPYYHDGSASTLTEVIHNYERGGRMNPSGDCLGDGAEHPYKDGRMKKFTLDEQQRKALIAFLFTLTDTSYLVNPHFVDPHN